MLMLALRNLTQNDSVLFDSLTVAASRQIPQASRQPHFSQAKILFQSFFMLMTNQPFVLASS
jgi:hypothetical protein